MSIDLSYAKSIYEHLYRQPRPYSFETVDGYTLMASLCKGLTLDVACGVGGIEQANPDIVGTDFSLSALKRAKEKGAKYLVLADAHYLPFRNDTFDSIVSINSLQHMDNEAKVLLDMRNVLKPSGYVVLTMGAEEIPLLLRIMRFLAKIRRLITRKPYVSEQPHHTLGVEDFRLLLDDVGLNPFMFGHVQKRKRTIRLLKSRLEFQYPNKLFLIALR